jgi:threonine synthase
MHELAGEGFRAEPASALAVACMGKVFNRGVMQPGATAVYLLTSAGIEWPGAFTQDLSERQRGCHPEARRANGVVSRSLSVPQRPADGILPASRPVEDT